MTSVFPVDLFSNSPPPPKGIDGKFSGRQGQVLVVKVPEAQEATKIEGKFLDRTILFFREMRPGVPAEALGYSLSVELGPGLLGTNLGERRNLSPVSSIPATAAASSMSFAPMPSLYSQAPR